MIERKFQLKRSPLRRKARKKRAEGVDDPAFLEWLRTTWPCYVCLRAHCERRKLEFWVMIEDREARELYRTMVSQYDCGPTDAAHIGVRGLLQKSPDREAIPLGKKHHLHQTAGGGPESHHTLGKRFWEFHGLERETVIAILNRLYQKETGK